MHWSLGVHGQWFHELKLDGYSGITFERNGADADQKRLALIEEDTSRACRTSSARSVRLRELIAAIRAS